MHWPRVHLWTALFWLLASGLPAEAQVETGDRSRAEAGNEEKAGEDAPAGPQPAPAAENAATGGAASGQSPAAKVGPADQASAAAPPEHDAPPPPEVAAEIYDRAFAALAAGNYELANRLLRELRTRYPDHRLAGRAAELQALLAYTLPVATGPGQETEMPPGAHPPAAEQRPTGAARAELLFFQTMHGVGLGAETCLMLDCEDAQPFVLSMMVGGGSGFGLSLALSSGGVTPGLARALTSGTYWGLLHGAMIGIATGWFDDAREEEKAAGLGLAAGQLSGLALGGVLYSWLQPTAGQVSLTSSGGIWAAVAVGMGLMLANPDNLKEEDAALALLLASDAGLIGGGYLASLKPMSAGRVLLIDAGGLLGTLSGMGAGVLIIGDEENLPVIGGLGLLGAAGGLGLAYYLTMDWDEEEAEGETGTTLSVLPVPGGAIAAARVAF